MYHVLRAYKHNLNFDTLEELRSIGGNKFTLLKQNGSGIPARSGLNWGQRPGREPNQAYIGVPAHLQSDLFLPRKGVGFDLYTDDGYCFRCARAQDNGKAIESTSSNSLLGLYFRMRLGLESGAFVEEADLMKYGRTHVTISKIDNDKFFMDFSKFGL